MTPKSCSPRLRPLQLGGDGLVERQALLGAELGAVAHLQVAEVIAGRILAHLVGHALDGLGRLQHRDGGVELPEELLEVMRVIHQHEAADVVGVARGERGARLAGELDQRLGAERPVEVHMELSLGQPCDELTGEHQLRASGREAPRTRMIEPGPTGSAGDEVDAAGIGGAGGPGDKGGAERGIERGHGIGDGGGLHDVHRLLVHEKADGHFFFCTKAGVVGARTGCAMRLR